MHRREFLLVGGALLSGCVNRPLLPLLTSKAPTKQCCTNVSETNYISYPGSLLRLEINEESSVFDFRSGTSRFAGLKLKPEDAYSVLEVTTTIEGIWLPHATIYIPTFSFLNAAFSELATIEPTFYLDTGKLDDPHWGTYYGACFVPQGTRYILIFADASKLTSIRVKYLNPDSYGAAVRKEKEAREMYRRIDKRDYAAGRVRALLSDRGYTVHNLSRQASGELRVLLT